MEGERRGSGGGGCGGGGGGGPSLISHLQTGAGPSHRPLAATRPTTLRPVFPISQPEGRGAKLIPRKERGGKKNKAAAAVTANMIGFPRASAASKISGDGGVRDKGRIKY